MAVLVVIEGYNCKIKNNLANNGVWDGMWGEDTQPQKHLPPSDILENNTNNKLPLVNSVSFPFSSKQPIYTQKSLKFLPSKPLMANPQRGGAFYGADPYRSREGLSTRPVGGGNQDEIQLRIDPIHDDLDEEITGLHSKITRLKNVAQVINTEAKFQNNFLTELQMTMIQAQAGVKNNMRRLNRSIIQQGSNHLYIVIMFALGCFFLVYLYTKFSRGR